MHRGDRLVAHGRPGGRQGGVSEVVGGYLEEAMGEELDSEEGEVAARRHQRRSHRRRKTACAKVSGSAHH